VLIEFFAHWCAPCARQIPKLNRLQKAYGERGLVVLGVTSESPEDIDPWGEEHGAAFPYAYDPGLALEIDLGFQRLPYALPLDATGTLAWSGHTKELEQAHVEAALEGALSTPVWAWRAGHEAVRQALREERCGDALAGLPPRGRVPGEVCVEGVPWGGFGSTSSPESRARALRDPLTPSPPASPPPDLDPSLLALLSDCSLFYLSSVEHERVGNGR